MYIVIPAINAEIVRESHVFFIGYQGLKQAIKSRTPTRLGCCDNIQLTGLAQTPCGPTKSNQKRRRLAEYQQVVLGLPILRGIVGLILPSIEREESS